ncbi:MAG TPA: arylsulfatase [Prolixibacteraceae bacterium]|nr:arylsulfatase [Prolixibacteraceae bacterium]
MKNLLKSFQLSVLGASSLYFNVMPLNASNPESKHPNIILIMADDMGYSDLGFMGSGIKTPNIDHLAKSGVVFSQFYNTGRCCPTRASLLTGLYQHNTGMGWMTASNLGRPGYTGDLNHQCVTIAQVLKKADYSCYMTGKWHVTYDGFMKAEGPKHNWPLQRGFDRFYGHLTGGGSYFSTSTLTYGNDQVKATEGFYLTRAITDSTVSFLNHHFETKKDKPFFFYVAYYAPHRPLHALQEDIAKYRGKFMNGWDKYREQRFKKLKEIGMIDPDWVLTERDESVPAWYSLTENEKKIWDARMAVYAAQIDRMDQGVGQIIETLRENGKLNNTMIIFLSDNGGCDEEQGGDLKMEDLPFLGNERPAQSYRTNWANVSNTPFREYKHYVHEGGISTLLIVHWPEKITSKGAITKQVGHVIDLMPTIVEVAGATYPEKFNGNDIHQFQGKSLLPCFNGTVFEREPLYFEHQANRAVIDGDWKLVSKATQQPPWEGEWELYNLKDNRTETKNLIGQQPVKAHELEKLWDKWATENHVYPLDNREWFEKIKAGVGPPNQ